MSSVIAFFLIANIPAFLLAIIGLALHKTSPKAAKILYILAATYFLIGAGICGLILAS